MLTRSIASTNSVFARSLRSALTFAAVAGLLAGGCGEDDDKKEEEEDPNVEACEHMKDGPFKAVTGAAAFSATAPAVDDDHHRYDVTLAGAGSARSGFVTFAAAKAGDYIIYTGAPVTVTVKSAAMVDVAVESSAASIPECTEVRGRHVYELAVGTYVIGLASDALDKVGIVIEPDAH